MSTKPARTVRPTAVDHLGANPGQVSGPRLRITLLGPVRVADATGRDLPIPTRKARALLGFLVLARGRPVSRARLAALLWEGSAEIEARGSLRQALSEIARALGTVPLLHADRESIRAGLDGVAVDALTLAAPGDDAWRDLPDAPLLDGLEGLGDAFGEWLAVERDAVLGRLRTLHERALERLVADPARSAEATEAARRLVALDPTHEAGWRALMSLLADGGDRARALQEFERCRAALRRTLEVEPGPETRELAARLRAAIRPPARGPTGANNAPIGTAPMVRTAGRLRVGVLPFTTGAGPPEADAPGLAAAHDAALGLARSRHFDVIAPMALAGLPDRSPDGMAALGLDYVVTGAVRAGRGPDGARELLVSLLDVTALARPVWSERVTLPAPTAGDGAPDPGGADRLAEVLDALMARLEPVILQAEGTRAEPPRGTDAGALVLRAIPMLFSMQEDRFARAGVFLAEAVTRDSESATAAAWAAQWHVFQIGQGWARDPGAALEEAERLATLAMSLDPGSAEALAIYGHVSAFLHKDFDSAIHYLGHSLTLNPHGAANWALSAATHAYSGDPAESLRRLARYRALAPYHPHDRILRHTFTTAHAMAGQFEQALEVGRRAVRETPGFVNGYKSVLVALGHLRMPAEARPYLQALLKREPDFTVDGFTRAYPFRRAEDREAYAEGLRRAGAK